MRRTPTTPDWLAVTAGLLTTAALAGVVLALLALLGVLGPG